MMAGKLGVEVDVGALQQQIGGPAEMGLVGPFLLGEGARDEPFAEMRDLGVGREQAWCVVGH